MVRCYLCFYLLVYWVALKHQFYLRILVGVKLSKNTLNLPHVIMPAGNKVQNEGVGCKQNGVQRKKRPIFLQLFELTSTKTVV